jgi:peptide/nickel transport system permease protein
MPASLLLRRLAWMPPTLCGITLVVFVALRAAPGDPSEARFGGEDASQASAVDELARARFRAEHLLDRSLARQYLHFLGPFDLGPDGHRWFGGSGRDPWNGLLALELGDELLRPGRRIADELAARVRVTAPLALAAAALAYLVAVPLGVAAALRRGGALDRASATLAFVLYSTPTFWLALVGMLAFGARGLGLLPVLGLAEPGAGALEVLRHAALPVAVLSAASLAYLSRQVRGAMVEALAADFVRAARAKGISERRVVWRHALPSSLLPPITLFASVLPSLIGGSVVVESVFGIPGMGLYAYEGLLARDYNVVMAVTTLSAVATMLGILASDLLVAAVDPRTRHER